MARTRVGIVAAGLVLALIAGLVMAAPLGLAQDETEVTPEGRNGGRAARESRDRPAGIYAGGCEEVDRGDVVALLTDLTAPRGDEVGQNGAVVAETSYTNVPLTLDEILAEDHVVLVLESADEDATAIACGEIGGVFTENGDLVIGLQEQNNSGVTGIAYLSPGGDAVSTDVSVFAAGARGREGRDPAAGATPMGRAADEADGGETPGPEDGTAQDTAADEAVAVDVSLAEWAIDAPTTLRAGRVTFNVVNDGTVPHNFEIEGEGIETLLDFDLQPGESTELEVDLEPGTYEVYCPVGEGSHRAQGMNLELTVE